MDDLVLSDAQKAHLQKVADGILQIYRTLARMRYLDPDWIETGPQDLTDLIDEYRSCELEDSVMYLYSVLPYLNNDYLREVDFYAGGEFVDYRDTLASSRVESPCTQTRRKEKY